MVRARVRVLPSWNWPTRPPTTAAMVICRKPNSDEAAPAHWGLGARAPAMVWGIRMPTPSMNTMCGPTTAQGACTPRVARPAIVVPPTAQSRVPRVISRSRPRRWL